MDALKYVSQILDDADSWETMMFLYDAAPSPDVHKN